MYHRSFLLSGNVCDREFVPGLDSSLELHELFHHN